MSTNFLFLQEAESLRPKLLDIRKALHRIPELGNNEYRTAELLERFLDESGITNHRRILNTAIIAKLEGTRPGRHSALRSDIDALPVKESTGCDFASEHDGLMHACGHDVHMAGALGAAMLLASHKDEFCGSVTLLFQPDEEGDGGALRMIESGALDGVDAVFGAHVDPTIKAGDVGIKYGDFYAASGEFNITVTGRSSHGAMRDRGIDALQAGAALVPEILAIPEAFNFDGVVTVGRFHSGTANNIIADKAELGGIMRTYGVNNRAEMCTRLEALTRDITAKFGADSECFINTSYPGIVNNHDYITRLVENSARETLGPEHVKIIERPLMTTEDFGYFIMNRPGSFYHIGAGCEWPLHSDKFLPDDDSVITASAVHAAVVSNFNRGLV
ncbi:MAG: amidohydrolase [Synergistaceae bacterium]|nr:amidohydrolase [Synergistaceae bacterium]